MLKILTWLKARIVFSFLRVVFGKAWGHLAL
jgi:hypothetical protein